MEFHYQFCLALLNTIYDNNNNNMKLIYRIIYLYPYALYKWIHANYYTNENVAYLHHMTLQIQLKRESTHSYLEIWCTKGNKQVKQTFLIRYSK